MSDRIMTSWLNPLTKRKDGQPIKCFYCGEHPTVSVYDSEEPRNFIIGFAFYECVKCYHKRNIDQEEKLNK